MQLESWDQGRFAEGLGAAAEELLGQGLEGYISNRKRLEDYFAKIWPPPNVWDTYNINTLNHVRYMFGNVYFDSFITFYK